LKDATEKQLESAEAFTGRFAAQWTCWSQGAPQSDRVEFETRRQLLDVVNRAEKRGFVDRSEELREMKDVRNMIAHDYAGAKAAEFLPTAGAKAGFDAICGGWPVMPIRFCPPEPIVQTACRF